jgi:hypothetical protein
MDRSLLVGACQTKLPTVGVHHSVLIAVLGIWCLLCLAVVGVIPLLLYCLAYNLSGVVVLCMTVFCLSIISQPTDNTIQPRAPAYVYLLFILFIMYADITSKKIMYADDVN